MSVTDMRIVWVEHVSPEVERAIREPLTFDWRNPATLEAWFLALPWDGATKACLFYDTEDRADIMVRSPNLQG